MKTNYKGFCEHKELWDKNNVAYSLRDLTELAEKYKCLIPIDIQLKYTKYKVLNRLSNLWRKAENYYLKTRSGWQKERLIQCRVEIVLWKLFGRNMLIGKNILDF